MNLVPALLDLQRRERARILDAEGIQQRQEVGMERDASRCSGFNEQKFAGSVDRSIRGVRPHFKDFRK